MPVCATCGADHEEGAPCQSPPTVIEEGRPSWATEMAETFSGGLAELRGQVQELMTRAPAPSPPPAQPSPPPVPSSVPSGPDDPPPAVEPTPAEVIAASADPVAPVKRRREKVIRLFG